MTPDNTHYCAICAKALSGRRRLFCSTKCGAIARQRDQRRRKSYDNVPEKTPDNITAAVPVTRYEDEALTRIRAEARTSEEAGVAVQRFLDARAKRDAEVAADGIVVEGFEFRYTSPYGESVSSAYSRRGAYDDISR